MPQKADAARTLRRQALTPLAAFLRSTRFRQWGVFLVVVTVFSISIVYANVQTYDARLTPATGYMDTVDYVNMALGKAGTGIRAYRPLVPALARLVPEIPAGLFSAGRDLDASMSIAVGFGAVNLAFLIATCVAFQAFQRGLGLSYPQAFLGVLLFLGSQSIVRSAGLPMVDTAFYFFFVVCMLAVLRYNFWLLLLGHSVGVLAKELLLLIIPLILLSLYARRRKAVLLLAVAPGIGLYVWVRLASPASSLDDYVTGQILREAGNQLHRLFSPNGLINLFLAFGLAWIPAIYALLRCEAPALLRRWAWLAPLVFVGVVLGSGNLGRSMFTAFPVVMPLAALGLSEWLVRALPEGGAAISEP